MGDNVKEKIKVALSSVLGEYISNEVDLDNLVNYVYKVSVISFKDANIKQEYNNLTGINSMDIEAFKKAVKSISINASRDLMFSTLKTAFNSLKNQIPSAKAVSRKSSGVSLSGIDDGTRIIEEKEFEIDLSTANLGKPSMEVIANTMKVDLDNETHVQNVLNSYRKSYLENSDTLNFDIGLENLNNINKGISNIVVSKKNNSSDDSDNFDYAGDSSFYTSDDNDFVEPSVDIGLDY